MQHNRRLGIIGSKRARNSKSNRDSQQRAGLLHVITTVSSQKFILTKSAYRPNYPFDSYTKTHFILLLALNSTVRNRFPWRIFVWVVTAIMCKTLSLWLFGGKKDIRDLSKHSHWQILHESTKGMKSCLCYLPLPCLLYTTHSLNLTGERNYSLRPLCDETRDQRLTLQWEMTALLLPIAVHDSRSRGLLEHPLPPCTTTTHWGLVVWLSSY